MEPNFFSQKILEQRWLRKRSTISGLRRTEHPVNKEHWYQAASKVTKDDKQFILRSSNPWTRTQTKSTRLTKKEKFEFYQTLNGCVICLNTIPKQYIKTVTTSGTGRERRQDLRRGCARTVKEIIDDGTVENNISTSVAKAIAKDTLLEGNSVRDPQHAPNLETLDLQNKGTFFLRRTKRPQRGVAALPAAWTLSQAQRSVFVGRATELVDRRRGASIAPEGFACIQGLMKPEIRRKKTLEATSADTAEHRSSTARPWTLTNRSLQKVSTLETPRWALDPLYREGLRHDGRARTSCEVWDHVATSWT